MKIFAFSSLEEMLNALGNKDFVGFDTGVRGNECNRDKQWHLDQIADILELMGSGRVSTEKGAEGIRVLTACMEVSEQRNEPTIHSSLSDDDAGVRRFLQDVLDPRARLLGSGEDTAKRKAFTLAGQRQVEVKEMLQELIAEVRDNPEAELDPSILVRVAALITKLNESLAEVRQMTEIDAPEEVVDGIASTNKAIRLLNAVDKTGVKIPLIVNPNDIPRTAPKAPETGSSSGEGTSRAEAETPVSTDSRGSVQRRWKVPPTAKRPAQRKVSRPAVNLNRSRAQKARWRKVRTEQKAQAQKAKSKPKTSRKK